MSRGSSATRTQSVQDAKARLRSFLKQLDRVPTDILQEEASRLYGEIIAETPYLTGKLERSVKVFVAKDKRRPGINASASARSANGYNYAGIQHEEESFNHPVKGKAHFISEPFEQATARIIRKMNRRLKLSRR